LETVETQPKREEEAIRESENRYKFLVDNSKEIILILSKRGKIIFANKGTLTNYGYSKEELIGKSITNFLTRDCIKKALDALAQEFLGHPYPEMEVQAKTKSGEIRYLRVAKGSTPIYEKGKLIRVMVCASDTTALRNTEEELREREKRFRDLWDNAPVAYHTLNINGVITDVNQTEARMLGCTKKEMVGKSIFAFILPEQREEAKKRFQQKISGQEIPRAESRIYVKKDGSKIYVAIDDALERDSDGKVISVRTTMVNITEQKEMEAVLRESEKRYKDLVEKAGMAILVDDKEGNFKYVNERYARFFGYSLEEMKKQSIRSVVHPDDVEKVMAYHKGRLQGKKVPLRYEFKGVRKDGSIIYLEVDTVALREGENLIGTRSYLWDITERKRMDEMLRESEERFRSIVEYSHEGILIIDDAFRLIYCNDELCQIMGYSREEIIGQDFRKFLDKESEAIVVERYILRQKGEKIPHHYELDLTRKDGEKRHMQMSSNVIKDSAGKIMTVAQILDITERKQAEKALHDSERKLRLLAENMRDVVFVYDMNRRLQYVNPAVEKLTGYSMKELYEQSFINYLHPEDQERMMKLWEELFQGKSFFNEEFRIVTKDGQTKWCSSSWGPLLDEKRNQIGIQGREVDITERKRAEEQIKASLQEKDVLLREIHYRVKNNMQIISSLLNLQAGQIKDKEAIKIIKDSQSRIRSIALVHEELYRSQDFSRINFSDYVQSLAVHLFQFNQVNSNIIQLRMNLEDVFLNIQTAIPCGLILNELIMNSLMHAFPEGKSGEIMVELNPLEGHTFQIIVKDNGVGMPKDLDIRHTTTLGLQIVAMLVKQLEGSMEAQREGGTTVKIVFKELKYKSRF
jgi:PAS domain S-box-containing protein